MAMAQRGAGHEDETHLFCSALSSPDKSVAMSQMALCTAPCSFT